MSNLIPQTERDIYRAAIDDIHDTMSRPITVWKRSAEKITNLNPNYDAFSDQPIQDVQYTPQSKNFNARIKYIDKQDKEFAFAIASEQNRIALTQEFQLVRIKVKQDAADYIDDCIKVTIDSNDFKVITSARPHGLFDIDYYTFYLRSIE